jgi:hypothetical protein
VETARWFASHLPRKRMLNFLHPLLARRSVSFEDMRTTHRVL